MGGHTRELAFVPLLADSTGIRNLWSNKNDENVEEVRNGQMPTVWGNRISRAYPRMQGENSGPKILKFGGEVR